MYKNRKQNIIDLKKKVLRCFLDFTFKRHCPKSQQYAEKIMYTAWWHSLIILQGKSEKLPRLRLCYGSLAATLQDSQRARSHTHTMVLAVIWRKYYSAGFSRLLRYEPTINMLYKYCPVVVNKIQITDKWYTETNESSIPNIIQLNFKTWCVWLQVQLIQQRSLIYSGQIRK